MLARPCLRVEHFGPVRSIPWSSMHPLMEIQDHIVRPLPPPCSPLILTYPIVHNSNVFFYHSPWTLPAFHWIFNWNLSNHA